MEKDVKECSLPNLQEQEETDNLHNLETDSSGIPNSKTVYEQPEGTEKERSSTNSRKGASYSDNVTSRFKTCKDENVVRLPITYGSEQMNCSNGVDNYGELITVDSKMQVWTLDDSSPNYRKKTKLQEIVSGLGIVIDTSQKAETEPESDAAENVACTTYKNDQDNQKLVLSSTNDKMPGMVHTKTKSPIMKVMKTLVDYMEPDPILEKMMKHDMFRRSILVEIMQKQTIPEKNRALLKLILARDEPALTKFKECLLWTNQALILTLIENSEKDEDVDEITIEIKREADELMRPEKMLIRDLMASMTLKINWRKKKLYCFAYVKLGNKVCKALFIKRMTDLRPKNWDASAWTVDIFLDIRTPEIEATKLCHVIKDMLPTTNFESWDVPLLCVMSIKYCDVSLSLEQCLEWMVERPKKIAKCNEGNFENKFTKLKKHILIIADAVQDEDLIRTIREELDQLETGVIPDSNRAYISNVILRSKEDVIEEVRNQSIETRTAIQTCREEVKIVGKQGTETGNLMLETLGKILNKVQEGRPICRCPVPVITVKIVIETVNSETELVLSETVVKILNFENSIDDSAIKAATAEVRQTFKENDYTIIRSKLGCIKLYIQCSSVVSLLKFLRDYINGTLDTFLKPLEQAARLLDGCSDLQFKTIMYEADFNNILTYLDIGQFERSTDNVRERSWESWATGKAKTTGHESVDEFVVEQSKLDSLKKRSNGSHAVHDRKTEPNSYNNLPERMRCQTEPDVVLRVDSKKDGNSRQEIDQGARNEASTGHFILNESNESMLYSDPFEAEETTEENDDNDDETFEICQNERIPRENCSFISPLKKYFPDDKQSVDKFNVHYAIITEIIYGDKPATTIFGKSSTIIGLMCIHLAANASVRKEIFRPEALRTKKAILAPGDLIELEYHDVPGTKAASDFNRRTTYEQFASALCDEGPSYFEIKRRGLFPNKNKRTQINLPISLTEKYKVDNNIVSMINLLKHCDQTQLQFIRDNKLTFSSEPIKSLFKALVDKITILDQVIILNVATILAGRYSDSQKLQSVVKANPPRIKKVVILQEVTSFMKGVLIFTHMPRQIPNRVLKFTYGIKTNLQFREGIDPESKRMQCDRGDTCKQRFTKHIERGQSINVGEPQTEIAYSPLNKSQTRMCLQIYASKLENPQYTDDNCTFVGKLIVDLSNHGDLNRSVNVSLTFSGNEIVVTATDKKTGKESALAFDFLG